MIENTNSSASFLNSGRRGAAQMPINRLDHEYGRPVDPDNDDTTIAKTRHPVGTRRAQVAYFLKKAIQYAGALENLNRGMQVINDRMLGMDRLNYGTVSIRQTESAGIAVYGSAGGDLITLRARELSQVSGGDGHDAITINGRKTGTVRGNAGDDAIRVNVRKVGFVQGDNGDDHITVTALKIDQIDGGRGDDLIATAGRRIDGVSGGDGDDIIAVSGRRVGRVFSGAGDDVITADARQMLRVHGGDGDDAILLKGRLIENAGGGDGDDSLTIQARVVGFANGDVGDDEIFVDARQIHSINGGVGEDSISATAQNITTISGDAALSQIDQYGDLYSDEPGGDDTISVSARTVQLVHGGAGNDQIGVNAQTAGAINGGIGNDTMTINVGTALIRMGAEAGHDKAQIEAADHLTISFAGATLADLTIERENDTMVITAPNGDTLELTGLENIRELAILGSGTSEPQTIHLSSETGLDLRV